MYRNGGKKETQTEKKKHSSKVEMKKLAFQHPGTFARAPDVVNIQIFVCMAVSRVHPVEGRMLMSTRTVLVRAPPSRPKRRIRVFFFLLSSPVRQSEKLDFFSAMKMSCERIRVSMLYCTYIR